MTSEPLDLDEYFPFYLGTISNRWTAASSQIYLQRFGIGIGEWRILASIHALGPASSQQVRNLISMDASAVSRSMQKLEKLGHVKPVAGKFAGRTKPYEMTDSGKQVCNAIADIAKDREKKLLSDLTDKDKKNLFSILRKIMNRLDDI